MIKRISLVRKRAGLSRDEFFRRWTGEHLDWARQLRGIEELVVNLPFEHEPGAELPYSTLR